MNASTKNSSVHVVFIGLLVDIHELCAVSKSVSSNAELIVIHTACYAFTIITYMLNECNASLLHRNVAFEVLLRPCRHLVFSDSETLKKIHLAFSLNNEASHIF